MISMFMLAVLAPASAIHAQTGDLRKVVHSAFPDRWDVNRNLRSRNGKVLLWQYTKRDDGFEMKSCITLVSGPDSSGKTEYFISEKYADKKPFAQWQYGFIYYADYFTDSATGMRFGFRDVHIERYDHKPTESEIYALLRKWHYAFFKRVSQTIEAGLDEKLWLDTFGFVPGTKRLSGIE